MGFKLPKRSALIVFDDGDYAGAEVRVSLDVSMGTFFRYSRMESDALSLDDLEEAFRGFGGLITAWNLEDDDGAPVPVSADAFMSLPPPFTMAILARWQAAVSGVPAPLVDPSGDGEQYQGPPIPMVALSGSRAS